MHRLRISSRAGTTSRDSSISSASIWPMTKLRVALTLILAATIATFGYQRYRDHRNFVEAQDAQAKRFALIRVASRRTDARHKLEFVDRSTMSAVPRAYPRPLSEWLTNE